MDLTSHNQDELSVSLPDIEMFDPDAAAVTGSGRGHTSPEGAGTRHRMAVPPHEAAFLRDHYAVRGARWCAEQLGMSLRQIQRRTTALGLRRIQIWTPQNDDMLRFQWGTKTTHEIAKRLGRTPCAVYDQAGKLGLGRGCPRGYVYLSHLAREAGYSSKTTRTILAWAGVAVGHGPKNPKKPRDGRKHQTWVVDHVLGLEAVDRWLEAESVNQAAKRIGVHSETLSRWLAQDGRAGSPPGNHKRWKVSAAVIDAVVAARLK